MVASTLLRIFLRLRSPDYIRRDSGWREVSSVINPLKISAGTKVRTICLLRSDIPLMTPSSTGSCTLRVPPYRRRISEASELSTLTQIAT